MAGLFKKETGIYTAQFYDAGRSPKRRRVSTSTRVAKTAERLRRHWEAEYAEGRYDSWTDAPPVPGSSSRAKVPATVGEARASFLASRSHRAANTVANYERVTGWFADHVGTDQGVARVTTADVQQWIDSLEVKPVTRANYVRHLRAWFRYCTAHRLSRADPTENVRLERVPRPFPKALRPEQVERVAVYAEANCRDGRLRSSAWAAPFIRLGAETAMRRNELLNLRWSHVDLEGGTLTVACTDSFTSKSGAERRIPLSAVALSPAR